MSSRDEHAADGDETQPKKANWRQRHGTVLLLAAFLLLTILMVVYEKLSH